MGKKLLLSLLSVCFVSFATTVKADQIKLTSVKGGEITLSFIVSEVTNITVDWGNGTPVSYPINVTSLTDNGAPVTGTPTGEVIVKGEGLIAFDCNLSEITDLDVTEATSLIKLAFNNNKISAINLSKNTAIATLYAEINELEVLDIAALKDLKMIYANNNKLTGINISNNLALTTFNINNNLISAVDFSKNENLTAIYALGNQFETVDLSNNKALTYISFNNNQLTSIDVTPLTKLKSLFLLNNQLTSVIGAEIVAATATVNCTGNKLNFATLPQPGALRAQFNYAPQQALVIAEEIVTGAELDLSAQNNVQGVLAAAVPTTYAWATESGTALVAGTDYTELDGKFTFLQKQDEKVVCSMTTTAFPKFTGANVLKTTPISVTTGTGIDNETTNNVKVVGRTNELSIQNLAGAEAIKIVSLSGSVVYVATANSSEVSVNLSAGVYIVLVDEVAHKVIVK